MKYSAINRRLIGTQYPICTVFFKLFAVPARWRPETSLAADHLPLELTIGAVLHPRLLQGAKGGSTPPHGRRRPAEVRLLLFQERPPPDRPQWKRGRRRSRSGNDRPRRSWLRRLRRRPLDLRRPRRNRGGKMCRWCRLLGGAGHPRRDQHTGGHRSWYRSKRWVVAGHDGGLGLGCTSRRWAMQ